MNANGKNIERNKSTSSAIVDEFTHRERFHKEKPTARSTTIEEMVIPFPLMYYMTK